MDGGDIYNITVIMPIPMKGNDTFYGIDDLNDNIERFNKGLEEGAGWEFKTVDTIHGTMLQMTGITLDESTFIVRKEFNRDKRIFANHPLGNEYNLLPKSNVTLEKREGNRTYATFHSPFFFRYDADENVSITLFYLFAGYDREYSVDYNFRYWDLYRDVILRGPQDGWIDVNGTLSSRKL